MDRAADPAAVRPAAAARGPWWRPARTSPATLVAGTVLALLVVGAVLAPWLAPHRPYDLASLDLAQSLRPPIGAPGSDWRHPLGTDEQGRDLLSGLLYGIRSSLAIALAAVSLAFAAGTAVGLVAVRFGGFIDALFMRLGDIQLAFPAVLVAMLVDGLARVLMPSAAVDGLLAGGVIVLAIAMASWVAYARVVRAGAAVELRKDYVAAARLAGAGDGRILFAHVLPNVIGSALVLASINLATAIMIEATLSFLGVGLPPDTPSLGTMVATGYRFLFSGEWWLVLLPGLALVALCVSLNVIADGLRDSLDPRLR